MRILHVGKYYPPYTGGMETVVKDICEGQVKNGHHVDVLCFNHQKGTSFEKRNEVGVFRMSTFTTLASQPLSVGYLYQLKKMATSYDLIHVHSPNPFAEAICLTLPKHIPIVVTHHSDIVRQKVLSKFYRPLYLRFLERVSKIHVPTQNHIDYSATVIHYKNKCDIVPFGIRDEHLSREGLGQKINETQSKYGRFALFVGRLVSYKGLDVLIKAAKQTPYQVVIVGDGPLREELEKQVYESNLSDRVHILGKVLDNDEFRALYHSCHFLVLPSVTCNENFGMTQLEAMSCSKPVITTNLKSGVPAVGVRGKTTLITEPGDVNQLAGSMTMLMENDELQEVMGRAAREHYLKHYKWHHMVNATLASYERVLNMRNLAAKYSEDKDIAA